MNKIIKKYADCFKLPSTIKSRLFEPPREVGFGSKTLEFQKLKGGIGLHLIFGISQAGREQCVTRCSLVSLRSRVCWPDERDYTENFQPCQKGSRLTGRAQLLYSHKVDFCWVL